jgi:hypothetical protein
MKTVFNLLVVALAVIAGWYAHPSLLQTMETNKENAKKKHESELAAAVKKITGASTSSGGSSSGTPSAARDLAKAMRNSGPAALPALPTNSGKPAETAQPEMASANTTSTPASTAAAPKDDIMAKYPLPTFKEISEITREWSLIPSRAFPRQVKTLVAINLEGASGKVPLPAQSTALAVGMSQGMLVIMKSREEPARSLVPLANTDIKETLTALYEKYKTYKTEQVMKERQRARSLKERANGATPAELTAAGPKPKTEPGGIVTAMVESLRFKQIKETTEDRITAWGDLNVEEIDGKTYWTGSIQCTVDNPIFGPTPTEIMALIRDDKVIKWLYTGSKEEVQ